MIFDSLHSFVYTYFDWHGKFSCVQCEGSIGSLVGYLQPNCCILLHLAVCYFFLVIVYI